MAATVFLVHGTGARNAPWTQPGSALRGALELIGSPGEIACEPIGWSGSNFHSHRIAAAAKLAAAIQATVDRAPHQKVVVVGHSHGGTIASLMLSRHPTVVPHLSGVVYLSTPFIVASRRPHTEGLKRMSEHFIPILDGIVCLLIGFLMFALVNLNSKVLDLLKPAFPLYIVFALFATSGKVTCARLPGVPIKWWLANLIGIHIGIFVPTALASLVYSLFIQWSSSAVISMVVALLAFAGFAFASLRVLQRLEVLRPTVGDVSHISSSISQLLADFQQTSLPPKRALIVRFTSDEASLILAVAQATTKLLDFCVQALVGFFSTFGVGFWKAVRRPIGMPKRIFWIAVLATFLVLVTHMTLGFLSGVLGLVFASIDSLADALIHGRMPEKWNFSKSIPVRVFDWLEPYLKWSVDFSSMRYTNNPLAWATLTIVTALSACSLVLALPFGAMSFWGALYVNFSVESAPSGDCDIVTFNPPVDDLLEDEGFWATSNLAHSLAYLDPRSIAATKERIAKWVSPQYTDSS